LGKQISEELRPVRFPPDALDSAWVSFSGTPDAFVPECVALIHDESPLNGCALVVRDNGRFAVGTLCLVKVGRMDTVRARIVWKRELDPGLILVGLAYLD
jgi:hypothetical protein